MSQQITLPDGRTQDYLITGDPNGFPIFFIHGTPGSHVPPTGFPEQCKKKGFKCITMSRAGYGVSSRNPGRRIVDFVADIDAVKNHLGIDKCVVGGWSGGGPHSLACAARLPGCLSALVIAGVPPFDLYEAQGLDWLEGQGEDNIQEHHATMKGEKELREFLEPQRKEMLGSDAAGVIKALESLFPEPDKKAVLENPEVGQNFMDSTNEGLKLGVDGWVDDDFAFLKPWGFDLAEIKVPVFLYQGTEDKMVPFSQGEWLSKNLPKEKLVAHLLDGEGHVSIFMGRGEAMLDELMATTKA